MPTPSFTSSRLRRARRVAAGALAAVALPLSACGGDSVTGGSSDIDPAAVVPAAAAAYAELTVRPEGDLKTNVESLAQKIARTDDPGAQIVKLLDDELKEDNASFKDDIDPWLGDKVGVAITGVRNGEPDYALLFAATDTDKALAALKKGETGLVERTYKDVKYTFNPDEQQAAVGIKDTLVVATETALKQVIDVEKGADSLADSDKLKKARDSVEADRLAFFYVNPAVAIDLAAAASPLIGAQAAQFKALLGGDKVSAIGGALIAAADAIRVQLAVDGQTGKGGAADAAQTVASLPAGSVAAAGFGDVGARARDTVTQLGKLGGPFSTILSQFTTITGLDLQRDVLAWMGKGGAFLRAKGVADIGGALVVDTTDEAKTAAFIQTIRRLVTQFGANQGLRVTDFNGQGATGVQIATSDLPFPIIVASGGGKFVVAAGGTAVQEALKPTGTLSDDAQFKAIASKLGAKPALYVDFKALLGFADLAVGSDPDYAKVKQYLQAFTGLAAGGDESGGTTRSNLVIGVK